MRIRIGPVNPMMNYQQFAIYLNFIYISADSFWSIVLMFQVLQQAGL